MLSGSTEEPDNTNGSKSNHQHKEAFWRQVEMRNLTYTLSPHPRSLRSLTPQKGVKGRSRDLVVEEIAFQPDARSLYVDGLICTFVLSGSTEEPDNTNGSKSNHQHKEVSGVRLKCAT